MVEIMLFVENKLTLDLTIDRQLLSTSLCVSSQSFKHVLCVYTYLKLNRIISDIPFYGLLFHYTFINIVHSAIFHVIQHSLETSVLVTMY